MKLTDIKPAGRTAPALAAVLSAAFCIALLSSCSTEPIFAAIEREVKLKEPSLRGIVTSLVAVGDSLYAANGYLYKKSGGTGDWQSISTGAGERCANVATDGTSLYTLCTDNDGSNGVVLRYDGSGWTEVSGIDDAVFISSGAGGVFAFTGSDDSYTAYRITGTAAGAAIASNLATPVGSAGAYFATTGGVYTAAGALATGSPTSGLRGVATDGTNVFAMTGGDLYRFDGAAWTSLAHSVPNPTSLAWLGGGSSGKNMILIGGASGYGEVLLGTGGVLQSYQEPGSNDSSSIPEDSKTQYKNSIDKWAVIRIFAVTTSASFTASNHEPYALYAAVPDANYDGLWSFYPSDSSPNWNRE